MKPIAKGECDACPNNGDLFQAAGSKLSLCVTCFQAEVKAIEDSKWINQTLATAKIIDSRVELKKDIFNATTVSFSELFAAVQNDANVPADKKNETFVQAVEARIKKHQDIIFAKNAEIEKEKNECRSWSQNIQEFIGKLRADEREKYKKFNISYTPAPIAKAQKSTKPEKGTPATKKVAYKMADVKAVAIKYGVPQFTLQSVCVKRNLDPETAAKQLIEMMKPTVAK